MTKHFQTPTQPAYGPTARYLDGYACAEREWPRVLDAAELEAAAQTNHDTILATTKAAYEAALADDRPFASDADSMDAFDNFLVRQGGWVFDYDNQEEFHAYSVEEFKRGYRERVEGLLRAYRDNQRFAVRPEFAGRPVARITTEATPLIVGSIHNRSYRPDEATWMLECVACEGPTHNTDDEYGHRTSEDYYVAYWAEPEHIGREDAENN